MEFGMTLDLHEDAVVYGIFMQENLEGWVTFMLEQRKRVTAAAKTPPLTSERETSHSDACGGRAVILQRSVFFSDRQDNDEIACVDDERR